MREMSKRRGEGEGSTETKNTKALRKEKTLLPFDVE